MTSNSKANFNKKRPRGGIGCLVADKESDSINDNVESLRTEIVPLSRAFDLISNFPSNEDQQASVDTDVQSNSNITQQRRVRIVYPYPYTFATFAKARWIGRTVVDIYNDEFGERIALYYFIDAAASSELL